MLGHFIHDTWDDGSDTVNIPIAFFGNSGPDTIVYSGVQFGSDGDIYMRQTGGGWSRYGTWLLRGSASGFYLSRTILSGSLNIDAGAGPLVMSADRSYDVQDTFQDAVPVTASVNFEISSDISGTPVVEGPTTLNFSANRTA
jgi:hypothetical protein